MTYLASLENFDDSGSCLRSFENESIFNFSLTTTGDHYANFSGLGHFDDGYALY